MQLACQTGICAWGFDARTFQEQMLPLYPYDPVSSLGTGNTNVPKADQWKIMENVFTIPNKAPCTVGKRTGPTSRGAGIPALASSRQCRSHFFLGKRRH